MKKKILLATTLLSAVVAAGSTPLTAYAAETGNVININGKYYKVYVGQGTESLNQVLKDLGITIDNIGNLCPDIEIPGINTPETSNPPAVEEPDTQEPGGDISDEETRSYAEQVVDLVNKERAKAGLSALALDENIMAAANVRAKEIKQQFSHTRPNGSSFSSALNEQGVSFRGSGENIAWGQKTPEQVMEGWMNSEGHRANILNKNFKNIGVGYYQDENGLNHWVQLFTY